MATNRRLEKALKKSDKKKENRPILISGELGIPLNGQKVVEVPNRRGFVFVRLKNNTSELIQAYNSSVPPIYDLPVLVTRSVGAYKVVGRNIDRYTNQWTQAPFLPKHGAQHSFNPDLNIGGDVTWIYSQQFMPLLVYPSGTSGSPRLTIAPHMIRDLSGNWKYVGNTGTQDLSIYNPTTGSRAIMGLVYLDTNSGNPRVLINSGTYINASLTGTNEIAPYVPHIDDPSALPLAAFRLVSGTSAISWNNLYDVRQFIQVVPTGSGGGALSIWDEGVPLGTASVLNFVGQNVEATLSGTVARVFVTGSSGGGNPPVTGTIVISDDTTLWGSAKELNFGTNISAVISGTTAYINSSGGSLFTDDLTSFVNGTGTSFALTNTPAPNTLRLFYNGIRQRFNYHYVITGSYLYTLFTPVTGSVLIADYNESSGVGGGIGDGDNNFAIAMATGL